MFAATVPGHIGRGLIRAAGTMFQFDPGLSRGAGGLPPAGLAPGDDVMSEIEARISNRLDELPRVAAAVERFGLQHLVPSAVINDLHVALDEILCNIISYGFAPGERSEVLVRLRLNGGEIVAEIEDAGRPFDPLQAPPLDLSASLRDRKVGGLGIHFVTRLMDDVVYARVAGRNRLRLSKRLAGG